MLICIDQQLIREVGEALYGPRWQSELARDLGMSGRHMRRLAAGTAVLTPGMMADMLLIAEERAQAIDEVIEHLRRLAKLTPVSASAPSRSTPGR